MMVRFICAISHVIYKFFFVFLELMFNYSENECELAISDSIYYNLKLAPTVGYYIIVLINTTLSIYYHGMYYITFPKSSIP